MIEFLVRILFPLLFLLPPLYTVYLICYDPWSEMKKRRKQHQMVGDKWVSTEDGGMAIDEEKVIIYLYKIE